MTGTSVKRTFSSIAEIEGHQWSGGDGAREGVDAFVADPNNSEADAIRALTIRARAEGGGELSEEEARQQVKDARSGPKGAA